MNRPIVIIGPSGAGKSSVVKVLCEKYGFELVKTVTTRPQRDAFDTDHIFVSVAKYDAMKKAGDFYGTLDIFGAFYGLPKFNSEHRIVLLLRAPAIKEFSTMFPEANIVEIDAPLSILEERLTQRGSVERFEPDILSKEIALGRALANMIIDSSITSPEQIAIEIQQ